MHAQLTSRVILLVIINISHQYINPNNAYMWEPTCWYLFQPVFSIFLAFCNLLIYDSLLPGLVTSTSALALALGTD
jgi:TRAP-type mannitol/chloroaromatic compound transport system permease small subunit